MYRCQNFVATCPFAMHICSVCCVDMTEKYPFVSSEQQNPYGSGFMLPNPSSARVGERPTEYAEYLGVRLFPHEYLAQAVVAEAVSERATEYGVTLQQQGDVILFEPPVSAEIARRLGSLVNLQMHTLDKKAKAEARKHELAMSA